MEVPVCECERGRKRSTTCFLQCERGGSGASHTLTQLALAFSLVRIHKTTHAKIQHRASASLSSASMRLRGRFVSMLTRRSRGWVIVGDPGVVEGKCSLRRSAGQAFCNVKLKGGLITIFISICERGNTLICHLADNLVELFLRM